MLEAHARTLAAAVDKACKTKARSVVKNDDHTYVEIVGNPELGTAIMIKSAGKTIASHHERDIMSDAPFFGSAVAWRLRDLLKLMKTDGVIRIEPNDSHDGLTVTNQDKTKRFAFMGEWRGNEAWRKNK